MLRIDLSIDKFNKGLETFLWSAPRMHRFLFTNFYVSAVEDDSLTSFSASQWQEKYSSVKVAYGYIIKQYFILGIRRAYSTNDNIWSETCRQ